MKVTKTLRPGSDGTRRFQRAYGDRLVCVRYREDPHSGRRITTVELIAEEKAPAFATRVPAIDRRTDPNRRVHLRIGFHEHALRARVKAAGGIWIPGLRAWELRFGDALDLDLRARVIDDPDMDT